MHLLGASPPPPRLDELAFFVAAALLHMKQGILDSVHPAIALPHPSKMLNPWAYVVCSTFWPLRSPSVEAHDLLQNGFGVQDHGIRWILAPRVLAVHNMPRQYSELCRRHPETTPCSLRVLPISRLETRMADSGCRYAPTHPLERLL